MEPHPLLQYYPTLTQEEWTNKGRITNLIYSGEAFKTLETEEFNPEKDSVMLCGGPDFNKEMIDYFKNKDWKVGTTSTVGNFVYEKAFVG
jgi:ferredoxin--NADP+ reductase